MAKGYTRKRLNRDDVTPTRFSIGPRDVHAVAMDAKDVSNYQDLQDIGLTVSASGRKGVADWAAGIGFDAAEARGLPLMGTASNAAPMQFLRTWLPGFVRTITSPRTIDTLVGVSTVGAWEDHEIVQGTQELTGEAEAYGDETNIPLAGLNTEYMIRDVYRGEMGIQVGTLSGAMSARARIDEAEGKRKGAGLALEIQRNRIGFYGYSTDAQRTYGMLNDPELRPYESIAPQNGKTEWTSKDFQGITADLRLMATQLRTQSDGNVDPSNGNITLAIPVNRTDCLSVMTDNGVSVWGWLKETFPNWRVVSVPEFEDANGGQSVAYLYLEETDDEDSDDDHRTFIQAVPTRFINLGVERGIKVYREAYSNATAGVICKRPYAVARFSGI